MDHLEINSNIVLIGFMGVGKSAVASCLGARLKRQIVDMDEVIAKRQGMCISDIFSKWGERYFREQETKLLLELLSVKNTIVSCGGGAALKEENVLHMKKCGPVILLKAKPATVYERIKDCGSRPVLRNKASLEYIADLMESRRKKYEEAADIVVQTDHKTVVQVCQELMTKLTEMNIK